MRSIPACLSASLFSLLLLLRCGTPSPPPGKAQPQENINEEQIKKQFIKANQQLLQKENDEIDYYERSHKLAFVRTGSGVRYHVYKPSEKGDSIRTGMEVSMDYTISLLDGTVCYNSRLEGRKNFIVGEGEAESGVHKGLQYLKRGDKALLIIPSPLAHGLLGDLNKIPPQMPIVYNLYVY